MPVNTVIDKKAGVMIRTVTGELTFEDIKSSYEASLIRPDFQMNMHVIWDLRDADASKIYKEDVIKIDLPAEIGIFRSLEEAKKWVGESD